jgi:hypothetical protein
LCFNKIPPLLTHSLSPMLPQYSTAYSTDIILYSYIDEFQYFSSSNIFLPFSTSCSLLRQIHKYNFVLSHYINDHICIYIYI